MVQPIVIENVGAIQFNEFVPHEVVNGRHSVMLSSSLKRRHIDKGVLTDGEIDRSSANIIARIANTYFDEKGKDPTDFNKWIESMNEAVGYRGTWGKKDITEKVRNMQDNNGLPEEPWGALVAGLTAQRIVGGPGNAINYFLSDDIIKHDQLVIPALTALRDEFISLETGKLRNKQSSQIIEQALAFRGILIPGAWSHLYDMSTKVTVDQGEKFPLRLAFPELQDAQRKVLVQGALNSLDEAGILPKAVIEPASSDVIKKSAGDLLSVELGFREGERYSIQSHGKKISEVPFSELFHDRIEVGGAHPTLIADEQKQILETKEGKTSFLVGALMRALVIPPDSKYYSATDISHLFLGSSEDKALATSVLDNLSRPLEQIFETKKNDQAYLRVSNNISSCRKVLA
ncbi:hypothetical protein M1328_05595 [Patescibacteria group bacterium]|nr:hypothetical protein [Patescibacteria group bacterium]